MIRSKSLIYDVIIEVLQTSSKPQTVGELL